MKKIVLNQVNTNVKYVIIYKVLYRIIAIAKKNTRKSIAISMGQDCPKMDLV
jgi:hypothetical protein